jgi:hypothetical protein
VITHPRLRALLYPATERESTPSTPTTDPHAGWFVAAAGVGMAVILFGFVGRYAAKLPVFDEFCHLEILLGDRSYWLRGLFWQHNEHRLPLPRAVYFVLMKATGFDFKAPCYFNAGCLTSATLALLVALRRARGHFVYADAFVPLVVMSAGQWENLLWGFQVQFILSTALVLAFLALAIDPRFPTSPTRVGLAGAIGVLLPLCGANGVAFGPAVALFLGWLGVLGWRRREARRPAVVALVGAVIVVVLVTAYFLTLTKAEHHPPAAPLAALKGVVEMFALTAGPFGRLAEGPTPIGWPVFGIVVLAILLPTAALILPRFRDPRRRVQGAALAAVALGCCGLAVGVGYGRAGLGAVLAVNRYVTLMLPLAVAVYLAWALLAPRGVGRLGTTALLVAAAACAWPNAAEGNRAGLVRAAQLTRCEMEIKAGVTLSAFVDRHPELYPGSREQRLKHVRELKEKKIGLFARLLDDPP